MVMIATIIQISTMILITILIMTVTLMLILLLSLVLIRIKHEHFLTKYLLITLDEVILKNTKPDSVATALARRVFPVPMSPLCR